MENVVSIVNACFGVEPEELFECISTGEKVANKKPNPELYQMTLNSINLNPHECLAFEDSRIGLLSSKASKVPTIVSPSIYSIGDNFIEADYIVKNFCYKFFPKELKTILSF